MIAKHIPMRVVKKSDFRDLVEYLNDPQTKQERVGKLTVTNCQQDDPLDAALEVQATQAINMRTVADKTYHLIISFRDGEKPTPEILEAIEARVCAALGYGNHQRVSAVHHDTDNLHIHVAINKIHPTLYTIHTPYNDYKTLGDICEKLEHEYGLEQDNHTARKVGAENRAADMERHAGVESLLGWIKRECADQIKSAPGWAELHEVMRSHGLELQARGNGLVITDGAGLGVKASSVDRGLSKTKLEERLGAFEAPSIRHASAATINAKRAKTPPLGKVGEVPPPRSQNRQHGLLGLELIPLELVRQYEPRPIHVQKINTVELHARYKTEQQDLSAARTVAMGQARAKKDRLIEAAKRTGRLKRAAIKLLSGPGVNKRLLYAMASKTLRADVEKINNQYKKERDAAYARHHRGTWADWLQAKATQGDAEALAALRAREARQGSNHDTVSGERARRVGPVPGLTPDSITKAGTVIYRVGATAIRDDGELLNVSRGAGQNGLEAALRMAMYRYGDRITVNGSADFKERIAQVAAAAKLNVTFDDATLEQRRQSLVRVLTTREQGYGQRNTQRTGRSARVFREVSGPPGTFKPNIGSVGRTPPPESKDRLRNLSELGVVQLAQRSEVLLPSHVPNHVEQQGTQSDNKLRRDLRGAGRISESAATQAADKYIAERESKRAKNFDIPKHRRYNPNEEGAVKFAGLRQIDGEALILLKRHDEVVVLPIDAAAARRMKRLSVGDEVSLTVNGTVRTKGKSR